MILYVVVPLIILAVATYFVFFFMKKLQRQVQTASGSLLKILEIQVSRSEEDSNAIQTAPLAAEYLFASLHGMLREDYDLQEHFTFEITSDARGIRFYVTVPENLVGFVENQIYAQYPTAHIDYIEDYVSEFNTLGAYEIATLHLVKDQIFPIKTYKDFEIDPLSAVTSSLSSVKDNDHMWLQFVLKPIPDVWQEAGYAYVNKIRTGTSVPPPLLSELPKEVFKEFGKIFVSFVSKLLAGHKEEPYAPAKAGSDTVRLSAGQDLELKSIENKMAKMGFEVVVRVVSYAQNAVEAQSNLRSVLASMKQFSTANLNGFTHTIESNSQQLFEQFKTRAFDSDKAFILNIEELASIYHFPSSSVGTPNISWVFSKKSEPPSNLPTKDCTYIGETLFRDRKVRFGLSNLTDDRVRHMYLIGKSGTGKSTLFLNMIAQDIANGFGVGVLDPHGELIEKVLDYIPDERVDDVIILDPSDVDRPVGLNLLEIDDPSQKNLMASGLVSAIKHHFDFSWGPRLEYLLNYSILTLLDVPGTSIMGITRLLLDDNYRKYILHFVKDPVVLDFWEKEYKAMKGNQKLVTEAVAPIQNKINRFLSSTTIRNILGQKKSTIDFWDAMNSKKILLMNLSKGKIGEDNGNLLGALLVSRLQFMALQRVKIPSEERLPFYLYVDEFQNFATGSFESILSESRKYKLGLYLTHQYTAQLPENLLDAVYGNAGTIASFSLGAPDARALTNEFAPYFNEEDLISLERFQLYIKLMIDGMTSVPFSAKVLRPWVAEESIVPKTSNKDYVLAQSREKYGVDREYVDAKIKRWVEAEFDKGMAIAQEHKTKGKEVGEVTQKEIDLDA